MRDAEDRAGRVVREAIRARARGEPHLRRLRRDREGYVGGFDRFVGRKMTANTRKELGVHNDADKRSDTEENLYLDKPHGSYVGGVGVFRRRTHGNESKNEKSCNPAFGSLGWRMIPPSNAFRMCV